MKATHGSPLTASAAGRWSRFWAAGQTRTLAVHLAIGVVTALLFAPVKLRLGLPGHKILMYLLPIVTARLLMRHRFGATAGMGSATLASLAIGGHIAGGPLFFPLVILAGGAVDVAAALKTRWRLSAVAWIPLFAATGAVGGFLCLAKRLMLPSVRVNVFLGLTDPWASLVAYPTFGFAAGLTGAIIAAIALRAMNRRENSA